MENKQIRRFLKTAVILCIIVFPNVLSVRGDKPIIASRISEIIDISIITDPDYYEQNTTLFGIETEVEILNRDTVNRTVTEWAVCYPKVSFKADLNNQSLEMQTSTSCMDMGAIYTYQPNITIEYDFRMVYVNQSDLNYLPDGNYTLRRYIMYISDSNIVLGEMLETTFHMNSGIINITYPHFDNPHTIPHNINVTGETGLTIVISSLLSLAFYVIVMKARAYKKRRES